jgi:hypothetical protein
MEHWPNALLFPRDCWHGQDCADQAGGVVTDLPDLWKGSFLYLADLADAKPTAADYAVTVRKLYDVLVEEIGDPAAVREFLLFHVPLQHGRGLISKHHRELALKLLPKAPRQKGGRPKGALGDNAYKKRYQLYVDWTHDKTLNPSLSKEQFAKKRLGITDEDLKGKDSAYHRYRMNALLQKLKPARMKQLDEGQRRALDIIYPLILTSDQRLALQWREAKQQSPALTKEDFLQDFIFKWPRDRKRLPLEDEIIGEYLERLDQGEKLLIDSERG